uniref:14-3-3 protein epsilon n=1 Tax=Schistocephalus solidus TaxID=70667 RepID=A0A0V0J2Z1_SCHSO
MANREILLYNAKLAEQAERYDEMVGFMDSISKLGVELTSEERNLFSIGYKNFMGAKRLAWRAIALEVEHAERIAASEIPCLKRFKDVIEEEMRQLAHKLIHLIDTSLFKAELEGEPKAFYLKLKADYFRYLAEIETGNDKKDAAECSLSAYKDAYEVATSLLPPTHPIRLGIALNFSVFYYEIANSADRACKLAKQAFDDAIAELDNISEDNYKDATLVMQLIRDNLTLWTTDMASATAQEEKRPVR